MATPARQRQRDRSTNPARSGPYLSRQWCVDKYDVAARRLMGRPAAELPWTTKIERPGVMDLIKQGLGVLAALLLAFGLLRPMLRGLLKADKTADDSTTA